VRWNLTALSRVHLSDKGGFHAYPPLYQRHLAEFRRRPIRLLEIGIGGYDSPTWGGASLRMWRDYFRRGEIHGLDIEEKRIDEPRICVHRGDQSDQAFLHELARRHGPFEIVIDDGSHINAHIRASFEALFVDHLNPGGYYIVEDMSTAYLPEYGGGPPGYPGTSVELVQSLVDDVNRRHWADESARPVRSLHVYEKIAFIRRA
jgi:cephalosporin hydroxylase